MTGDDRQSAIRRLDAALKRIERGGARTGAAAMFAIMGLMGADVAGRYLFRSPIPWTHDVVGMYLMGITFYAALAGTFTVDAHVRVDLLRPHLSPRLQRVSEALVCGLALLFFIAIAVLAGQRSWASFAEDEVLSGLVAWPVWPSSALAALGSGLLSLRLGLNLLGHVVALLDPPGALALPSVSGGHGKAGSGWE